MCYDILERHDQFREFYSSVFLMDVIEHLESDRVFLKAAAYHIAPGGLVVINVPAVQGLFSKYDSVAGHFRRYSKAALAKLLIDCGFEPIRVSFWGISLVPILFARKCLMPFVPASKAIKIGFSPPSRAADSLFRLMMRAELSFPLRFPVGTSLIAIGRKSVHI